MTPATVASLIGGVTLVSWFSFRFFCVMITLLYDHPPPDHWWAEGVFALWRGPCHLHNCDNFHGVEQKLAKKQLRWWTLQHNRKKEHEGSRMIVTEHLKWTNNWDGTQHCERWRTVGASGCPTCQARRLSNSTSWHVQLKPETLPTFHRPIFVAADMFMPWSSSFHPGWRFFTSPTRGWFTSTDGWWTMKVFWREFWTVKSSSC